jgi:hypothetical protein
MVFEFLSGAEGPAQISVAPSALGFVVVLDPRPYRRGY